MEWRYYVDYLYIMETDPPWVYATLHMIGRGVWTQGHSLPPEGEPVTIAGGL